MRKNAVVCAILAMSMVAGPLAIAQGDSRPPFGEGNDRGQRNNDRDRRGNDARQSQRNQGNQYNNQNRGNAYGHDRRDDRDERGAGPERSFHRGGRLPPEYRNRQYVVENWRDHRLSAPPRGYHWVQVGGDYVLVAIATGIILQLLLNN